MSREQAAAIAGSGKLKELWQRLGFVLAAFIVYRIGTHVPVPGVDPVAISEFFNQSDAGIFDVLNLFSGGALQRLSVMALGVMPYISAKLKLKVSQGVVKFRSGLSILQLYWQPSKHLVLRLRFKHSKLMVRQSL